MPMAQMGSHHHSCNLHDSRGCSVERVATANGPTGPRTALPAMIFALGPHHPVRQWGDSQMPATPNSQAVVRRSSNHPSLGSLLRTQ